MSASKKKVDKGVVAEWAKGPNEVVRVTLGEFRGHTILNIRVWYQNPGDETFRPGKNGISLALTGHTRKIIKALKKAGKIAKAKGGEHE